MVCMHLDGCMPSVATHTHMHIHTHCMHIHTEERERERERKDKYSRSRCIPWFIVLVSPPQVLGRVARALWLSKW